MQNENENRKSLNPVADRVEKRTKEISLKSERIVKEGLDILENFIFKLLEIRPREYKQREYRQKERGDEK